MTSIKENAALFLVLVALFGTIHGAHAQGKKIKFYQRIGPVLSYDITDISTMKFSNDTAKWPTYLMEVFYDSSMQEYPTNIVDSIKLVNDMTRGESFVVYMAKGWDGYPIAHVDSITFTPAQHPPRLVGDSANADVEYIEVRYLDSFTHDSAYGIQKAAIWRESQIFCTDPIVRLDLNDSMRVIRSTEFYGQYGPIFLRLNSLGNRLLSVTTIHPDVSQGRLVEFCLDTNRLIVLDSGRANSSAVYVPGTENIIYYSYGSYSGNNKFPPDAGYYLLDRNSGKKTLILHHISSLGPTETVNGFDISPDGKKVLIPSVGYNRMPRVIEYDLLTNQSDTLHVPFNTSNDRWLLWLRYNHNGSKILYSSYPPNSIQGTPNDSSEVGIIDRVTLTKQVLNAYPEPTRPWVCVFPEWSPEEDKIVFCAGPVDPKNDPPGFTEVTNLYILKLLR